MDDLTFGYIETHAVSLHATKLSNTCKHGECGSSGLLVNGYGVLSCAKVPSLAYKGRIESDQQSYISGLCWLPVGAKKELFSPNGCY